MAQPDWLLREGQLHQPGDQVRVLGHAPTISSSIVSMPASSQAYICQHAPTDTWSFPIHAQQQHSAQHVPTETWPFPIHAQQQHAALTRPQEDAAQQISFMTLPRDYAANLHMLHMHTGGRSWQAPSMAEMAPGLSHSHVVPKQLPTAASSAMGSEAVRQMYTGSATTSNGMSSEAMRHMYTGSTTVSRGMSSEAMQAMRHMHTGGASMLNSAYAMPTQSAASDVSRAGDANTGFSHAPNAAFAPVGRDMFEQGDGQGYRGNEVSVPFSNTTKPTEPTGPGASTELHQLQSRVQELEAQLLYERASNQGTLSTGSAVAVEPARPSARRLRTDSLGQTDRLGAGLSGDVSHMLQSHAMHF